MQIFIKTTLKRVLSDAESAKGPVNKASSHSAAAHITMNADSWSATENDKIYWPTCVNASRNNTWGYRTVPNKAYSFYPNIRPV